MAKQARSSKHLIENSKLYVQEKNYDESNGPYNSWRDSKGLTGEREPAVANPDVLADVPSNRLWGQGTSNELAGLLIERYADELGNFPILSKRQNEVLRLTLMGMTVTEVALELKTDKRNVATYLKRIQSKLKRLIKTL